MFPGISKLFDLLLLSIIIMPIINAIPSMLPMAIPAIAPSLIPDGTEYVYIMKLKFRIALNDVDVITKIIYETGSVKFTTVFSVKPIYYKVVFSKTTYPAVALTIPVGEV